jgi:glycosyltransferase involved in cell wall biosynthesis
MVQPVLARCDLLYLSAHVSEVWRYGQSLNKVVDYMLAGKPIVASYTGFPSMINEAECGRFVPSGDVQALATEIVRLSNLQPQALADMGNRGRQWLLAHRTYPALALQLRTVLFPA